MATETIGYRTQKGDTVYEGSFEYEIPESVQGCIDKFGDENVRLGFKKSLVIWLQAWARRERTKEEDPKSADEVAAMGPGLMPEFSEREYVDPVEKIAAQFGKLGDEQKEKLIASLREMLTA